MVDSELGVYGRVSQKLKLMLLNVFLITHNPQP